MKKFISLSIMLIVALVANAQLGYWFQSNFIELTPVGNDAFFACPKQDMGKESHNKLQRSISQLNGVTELTPSTLDGFLVKFKGTPPIKDYYISPCYKTSDNRPLMVLPEIAIGLHDGYSIDDILKKYGSALNVRFQHGNYYRLSYNTYSSDEVLKMVASLYTENAIEWCEPNMLAEVKHNNTFYSQQYCLKNTGQTGGTAGMDINVESAWQIITASQDVTVAVIDNGVDDDHEDLTNCVLEGYTVGYPNAIGRPQNYNSINSKWHGTACAGILAADNNDIGIRGCAHGVKILPVNIFPYLPSDTYPVINQTGGASCCEIAEAILWAYERADILSCSWSTNYCNAIVNAINEARTLGRNGKGSIVVFASGNDYTNNTDSVAFPGTVNGVITVGALDKNGAVCSYSQRNQGLDLVAFGGDADIVTLDRMGTLGATDGNYLMSSGTSLACPQVSGIAALMLSLNPDLTETQVRNILKDTSKKFSAYTYNYAGWSSQVGYGLVDAEAALLGCLSISGPDIPQASSTYSVPHLPSTLTVTWEWADTLLNTPPQLTQNSPTANHCTINNSTKEYIHNTLRAIIKKNGTPVATLEKGIDTGANFYGTYEQETEDYYTSYVPACGPLPFYSDDLFSLFKGSTITLRSPMFNGATFTVEGSASPSHWTHSGGIVTFDFPYHATAPLPFNSLTPNPLNPPLILGMRVTGRCANSYETFQFTILPREPMLSSLSLLLISSSDNNYTFTLPEETTTLIKNDSEWKMTITNSVTGKTMYVGSSTGASQRVNTASWDNGIYTVQIRMGESVFSQKFAVSK